MRLTLSLSGLLALFVACGAPDTWDEQAGEDDGNDYGSLSQALTESFSGTVAQNATVSRGPLSVQPGSQLRVVLSGTGDADLYVRFGSKPTLTSYDCRPYAETSAEQCVLTVPANATSVFVDVRGYTASSYALSIDRVENGSSGGTGGSSGTGGGSGSSGSGGGGGTGGSSSGGTGGGSAGSGGSPITETFSGTVARDGIVARGPFAVQPGSRLRAVLSGTGDADLYVRFGSPSTLRAYDCRPYEETSAEECVLTVPANATTAFVDVRGYTASNYSLSIERVTSGGGSGGGGTGGSGSGGSSSGAEFVIAVLGSSTAEGEGASSVANSWVGLLESALSDVANVSITNLATGGYTTLELLPGSGASGSIDAAIDEEPDLIVVGLAGSNDLDIGTSATNYLSRLTQVRDKARAVGIPTFFVGTAPKDLSDSERLQLSDWNTRMRSSFSACWTPTNASYSPCFMDVFTDLANSDLGVRSQYIADDGFHLNDAGHRVIYQDALGIIEPYVCSVRDCR